MFTARNAVRDTGVRYKRHQPELTLLYQIIETYYPDFLAYMESQGKTLPIHIKKEYDAYLKCGRLEQGFFRVCCEHCHHERLCRYICRPAVSEKRLAMTPGGRIRYQLKTPYRNGTTHVFFQPFDFIARLAALVPKPRVNLTRFHGVLAPNSKHRVLVTPAHRGKG